MPQALILALVPQQLRRVIVRNYLGVLAGQDRLAVQVRAPGAVARGQVAVKASARQQHGPTRSLVLVRTVHRLVLSLLLSSHILMVHKLHTYYETYPAMGCTIKICLTATMSQTEADVLLRLLKKKILSFEKRCSRFLTTSELSRFNKKAGTKQGVTPQLLDIFTKARDIGLKTNGLYNPFVLPVLQRVGYLHSIVKEYENDPTDDFSNRVMTSIIDLELGDGWAKIPYGTAIDLGGCGKGYIGDQLADIVDTYNDVKGYWLSMGGDIVARGVHESGQPIMIGLQDETSKQTIAKVHPMGLDRYAVATSTILRRRGSEKGVAWHHIIDPRTAQPADTDILTASVCVRSLFDADVHATNCIIMGAEKASIYLKKHEVSDALLQLRTGDNIIIGDGIKGYVDKAVN